VFRLVYCKTEMKYVFLVPTILILARVGELEPSEIDLLPNQVLVVMGGATATAHCHYVKN
jgi:hypothetical protein